MYGLHQFVLIKIDKVSLHNLYAAIRCCEALTPLNKDQASSNLSQRVKSMKIIIKEWIKAFDLTQVHILCCYTQQIWIDLIDLN